MRTKELIQFFEKVGPVKEAQIVKDRVSGRSKGYVDLLGCIRLVMALTNMFIIVLATLNSRMKNRFLRLFSLQAKNF